MNAIRVLVEQHRAVAALFEELAVETRRHARRRAVSRLAEELIAHIASEEAVFYPAARKALGEQAPAREPPGDSRRLLRIQLRRVLEVDVADPSFGGRLDGLRTLFELHVSEQEDDLFKRVRAALGTAELGALGAEVLASRPPVWIVTREGPTPAGPRDGWALRSRVSVPIPPARD